MDERIVKSLRSDYGKGGIHMSNFYLNMFSRSNDNYFNNDIFNNIGEYSSVSNGSYRKLLRSYYKKNADNLNNSNSSTSTSQKTDLSKSQVTSTEAKEVKTNTDSLRKSALTLTKTGSKSLFNKKEVTVTDEKTGEKTTTKQYDKDAIVNAVKSFVKDYNETLNTVGSISNKKVARNLSYMEKQTSVYKSSLEKVGITIDADNKLSINEEKLKKADMIKVKSLFNGSYSFAAQTSKKANQLQQTTATAANNSYLYNRTGRFDNNNYYSSFNSYF
jgi:hypothetical protein